MIGRAIQFDICFHEPAQRIGECGTRGIKNRGVIESGAAAGWRGATETFPRIQSNVMMVTSGGNKRGLRAVALDQFKPEHAHVEVERALQVSDFQMDMADANTWINWQVFYRHEINLARRKKMAIPAVDQGIAINAPIYSLPRSFYPMAQLDPVVFRELPVIRKVIDDETWYEGERRGCYVSQNDPVVRENVCMVILRIGRELRERFTAQITAQADQFSRDSHDQAA
jgi:hypothetical protein